MPYSIVIDGKVHDVIFRRHTESSYAVYIVRSRSDMERGTCIGIVHHSRFGWTAAVNGCPDNVVPVVDGFMTRWKAREYLVKVYERERGNQEESCG